MIEVRFYAAAREAAGAGSSAVVAESADQLREALAAAHGPRMAQLLPSCTLLQDGRRLGPESPLSAGAVVEVLPPFAGG